MTPSALGRPVAGLSRSAWSPLNRYVTALCLLTALTVVLAAVVAAEDPVAVWALVVAGLLMLGADQPLLNIRFGRETEAYTGAEVCVLVVLFLLPLPAALLVAAPAVLLYHLVSRVEPIKVAFNASSMTLGVLLAGLSLEGVAAGAGVGDPRYYAGLAAAGLAFSLWNGLATDFVIALAQSTPFREVYRKGLLLRSVVTLGNTGLGVALITAVSWDKLAVIGLLPVLALLYVAYRGYLHTIQERDVWQQLESAAREMNRLDEREVATAVVVRLAQLLKADTVEVVVGHGSSRAHYLGDGDGLHAVGVVLDAPIDRPVLVTYTERLLGPQGPLGLLRVGFSGPVRLTRRERQIFTTFAHSVSSTLQNARLYAEMRQHAELKAHEAAHDALTGLGNRVLLHERAHDLLRPGAVATASSSLLIVDLDHFKEINDTLGHTAGDLFLRQVGERIRCAVPEAVAVCRLGGDEFAVLLGGLDGPDDGDAVARRLLRVLAEPVVFDGLRLSVEGSVGVASHPEDAATFDELLQRADIALYQAKCSRGSFQHYRADRDDSSVHRLALAAELRTALSRDELVVFFQPQFELAGGQAVGAEALVRWQHPTRGLLPPSEFVSAVEHSGLVRDFTLAVLEKAVSECAVWHRSGKALTVAVNLSARNLLDRDLPSDVARVLSRAGLAPSSLVLEITETTMMSELDVVEEVLAGLRSLGVQLAVDDFGTGYSSLAFLQRVQVNEVKVDRSFVQGIVTSDNDRALVRATVQLAHSLGARAVGEGVEDPALLEELRALGCDVAQGYHLARPLPRAEARVALGLGLPQVPAPREEDGRHLRAVALA